MAHHGAPTATGVAPIRNATHASPIDPGERPRRERLADRGLAHADTLAGDNGARAGHDQDPTDARSDRERDPGQEDGCQEGARRRRPPRRRRAAKKTPPRRPPPRRRAAKKTHRQEDRRKKTAAKKAPAKKTARADRRPARPDPRPPSPAPKPVATAARTSAAERAVDAGAQAAQHRGPRPAGRPGDGRARGRRDRRPGQPAVRVGDLRAHQDPRQEHQARAEERARGRRPRPGRLARQGQEEKK